MSSSDVEDPYPTDEPAGELSPSPEADVSENAAPEADTTEGEGQEGNARGGGLTIREAALRSGMTEKMIRVRIRNGTIESWKVQGKFGAEWRVRLPGSDDATGGEGTGSSDDALPQGAQLAAAPADTVPAELLSDLMQRHEELAIRLGRAEAQIEAHNVREAEKPAPPPVEEPHETAPASPSPAAHTPPNQSVERLQRIARGEAEARHKAEAEVARLQDQLRAAESMVEEMKQLIKMLGMSGK